MFFSVTEKKGSIINTYPQQPVYSQKFVFEIKKTYKSAPKIIFLLKLGSIPWFTAYDEGLKKAYLTYIKP